MKSSLLYSTLLTGLFALPMAAATERIHILDKNGTPLVNAVVTVPQAIAAGDSPASYAMDQVDRQFQPRILPVPINSTVHFPNSDDVRHHVYSFSEAKSFELRLYHADEADPVTFNEAGIVTIGCNIHDNMRAYILVTASSVFGQTDNSGNYQLPASASNVETVEAWYPPMDQPLSVNIDANVDTVTVTLPVEPLNEIQAEPTSSLEQRLQRYKRDAQ